MTVTFLVLCLAAVAAARDYPVAANNVGYLPRAPKFCLARNPPQASFYVQKGGTDVCWRTVFEGRWQDAPSGSGLKVGDFSAVVEPGDYRILLSTNGLASMGMPGWRPDLQSYLFAVREDVYDMAERLMFGYVRYQRCGDDFGWAGRCHREPVPLLDAEGRTVRQLDRRDMNPWNRAGLSSSRCGAFNAIYLSEAAALLGRADLRAYAQRSFDSVLGANEWNASFVECVGQNQWQRPVFGQFFPTTPQIPGGVLHVSNGEYDMPPTMLTLWASAVLARSERNRIP